MAVDKFGKITYYGFDTQEEMEDFWEMMDYSKVVWKKDRDGTL
jgi:hypothetical protein